MRLYLLSFVVVAAMGLLISRLYELQVYEGKMHAERLRNQTMVSIYLSPARGALVDRHGVGLAENRASFDIDVNLVELVGSHLREKGAKGMPKTRISIGSGSNERKITQTDVAAILEQKVAPTLRSLGLGGSYSLKELQTHYYQKPTIPFPLAKDIDFEMLSRFAEASLEVEAVQEAARPVRRYVYGAFASHMLGYVGVPEEQSKKQVESEGKAGLEATLDTFLQGVAGSRILRKNSLGYILGLEAEEPPRIGNTVYLTLDARIQHIAEQAMRGVGRGAAVVMEPSSGDILAMVAVPNFDPNDFVPKVDLKVWRELNRDPTKPLLDRSLQSYAAGSTYKTITTMAALTDEKLNFTPKSHINSPSAVWIANRWWPDWYSGGRGSINLITALQWSCNTFFYQLGVRTGGDDMARMAKTCGMGQKILQNIDGRPVLAAESPGVVPGPQWMEEREDRLFEIFREKKKKDPKYKFPRTWREKWSDGHSANTSIGQGFVEVTPLQMTSMMAAVANGGTVYHPRLVRAITDVVDGQEVVVRDFPPEPLGTLGLKPGDLAAIQQGLRMVVEAGTGKRAGIEGWKVAGKTGTAQFKTTINGVYMADNKAWFNGYAPFDEPRYVVTVMVEGGTSGGGTAGPIVHNILEGIYQMEQGVAVEMTYLDPAEGHFFGVVQAESATPTQTQSSAPLQPVNEDADDTTERRGFFERMFGPRRRR
jgi:penicillin-binding protein 2